MFILLSAGRFTADNAASITTVELQAIRPASSSHLAGPGAVFMPPPRAVAEASLRPLRRAQVTASCLLMIFALQCQSLPSRCAQAFFLIKGYYLSQPINFMPADLPPFCPQRPTYTARASWRGGVAAQAALVGEIWRRHFHDFTPVRLTEL